MMLKRALVSLKGFRIIDKSMAAPSVTTRLPSTWNELADDILQWKSAMPFDKKREALYTKVSFEGARKLPFLDLSDKSAIADFFSFSKDGKPNSPANAQRMNQLFFNFMNNYYGVSLGFTVFNKQGVRTDKVVIEESTQALEFACAHEDCTSSFSDPYHLELHRLDKHDLTVFLQCPICGTSVKELSNHARAYHPLVYSQGNFIIPELELRCIFCPGQKPYVNLQGLKRHINNKHIKGTYKCSGCEQSLEESSRFTHDKICKH